MRLNRKASLLFLISFALYLTLSVVLSFGIGLIEDSSDDLLYLLNALVVSIPAFLIPALVFRRRNELPRFTAPRFGHIMLAVAIGIGCVNLNAALSMLNSAIFYNVDIVSNSTTAETIVGMNGWNLLFSLAIIPPISEEFLMRGALLESWRRYSPLGAVVITSLFFAFLHLAPSSLIVYFGLGVLLAVVYLITRNVWLTVVVHLVNNLSSVIGALALKYMGGAEELAEEAGDVSGMLNGIFDSRAGLFGMFIAYSLIAAAILVPLLFALRAIYRRNKLGMYAEESSPAGIAENGEIAPLETAVPEEKTSMWSDALLWVAFAILVLFNIVAGLSEFGIIKL